MRRGIRLFTILFGIAILSSLNSNPVFSQDVATSLIQHIKTRGVMSPQEFQQMREKIRAEIEERKIQLKERLNEWREEVRSKVENKRVELKKILEKMRNQKDEEIIMRVYDRINKLNERMTEHYLQVLEKLERVLERIESRAAKAHMNEVDVSKVEQAINNAKVKIEEARNAVIEQSKRVYAVEARDETTVKDGVKAIRKKLHEDLKRVEQLVKSARDAVHNAAVLLAQIPNVDKFEVPTSTKKAKEP